MTPFESVLSQGETHAKHDTASEALADVGPEPRQVVTAAIVEQGGGNVPAVKPARSFASFFGDMDHTDDNRGFSKQCRFGNDPR